jgi:hypothetical protein
MNRASAEELSESLIEGFIDWLASGILGRFMVEILSFEPYHIGTKLQAHVDLGTLGNKLRECLKAKQYALPLRTPVEFLASIPAAAQVLGNKDGVSVWFNIAGLALNVTGPDPSKVSQVFRETNHALSELGYDPNAVVAFYEIVSTIVIASDTLPTQSINKSVHIDLGSMGNLGEIAVDSLRIVNLKPTEEQGAFMLVVEPNPNNPDKSYSARLLFRSSKPDNIEAFHSTLKEKLVNVIKSIEA